MTGLNDVVWFGSWLLTLLFQGTVTALIASLLSFFFIFDKSSFFVVFIGLFSSRRLLSLT